VFRAKQDYARASEAFLDELKAVPPAPGFEEVMIPGEPETRCERERSASGIPIADEIWRSIEAAARLVSVDVGTVLAPGA
jgi:LDH2 family malate/lactate/ureidoglycolate dehydrogenase